MANKVKNVENQQVSKNQVKKSAKKVVRVIDNEAFTAVFSGLKTEATSLNATLRNMQARALVDENTAKVCEWLGIEQTENKAAFSELRNRIVGQVVYFTKESEDKALAPVNIRKVAEVDGVTYFESFAISWTTALKMIANRKNKGLEDKHEQLQPSVFYTKNKAGEGIEVVKDSKILAKIKKAIEEKKAVENEKDSLRKAFNALSTEKKREALGK